MQVKNKVFAGRRRHAKKCLQQEPHFKKCLRACENFPPPSLRATEKLEVSCLSKNESRRIIAFTFSNLRNWQLNCDV